MDASIVSTRKQREKTRIIKLRTIYPCDLNDHLSDEYKREDTHTLVGNKFPPLPIKQDKVYRRESHKNNNSFSPGKFFIKLKQHLSHNQSLVPNFCRVSFLTMNKYNLKKTAIILEDNLDYYRNSVYFKWYFLALEKHRLIFVKCFL